MIDPHPIYRQRGLVRTKKQLKLHALANTTGIKPAVADRLYASTTPALDQTAKLGRIQAP
jgi:hypothetical protein